MTEDHTVARAAIAPVAFAQAEPPSDCAFLCADDGRTYRVRRVRRASESQTGQAEMLRREYTLTVVALGDDGLPERNAAGEVVIIATTAWIVDAATFAQPGGLGIEEQQALVVENLIHSASRAARALPDLDALDEAWERA